MIFDSLNGHTSRARIVATLREWVAEEYRTKHNGAVRDFSSKTMKGTVVKVPQQPNYTDCGLFVMHYFQKFFEVSLLYFIIMYRFDLLSVMLTLLFLVPNN